MRRKDNSLQLTVYSWQLAVGSPQFSWQLAVSSGQSAAKLNDRYFYDIISVFWREPRFDHN